MDSCILITFPFSLGCPGGGVLHCKELACHLQAAGAEVVLMPVLTEGPSKFPRPHLSSSSKMNEVEKALKASGVQVLPILPHPIHFRLDGIPVRKAVKTLLLEKPVDAVLGWFHEVAFLSGLLKSQNTLFGIIAAASYAKFLFGKPSGLERLTWPFIRRRLFAKPIRNADVIFATSNHTRQEIVDLFGAKKSRVDVANCGVAGGFSKISRSGPEEVSRLIYFGQLSKDKGIFDAIEALGQIASRGCRNWTFKIIGGGNLERVKQAAEKHGIANKITLREEVDHIALARELEWAQLAIMPSQAESFGLAIAESQAAGLAVVGYKAGAVPEVVKEGITGWLVAPGRVDLLAESIMDAIQNPQETYCRGLNGRERIQSQFSWQRTAVRMIERIKEIKAEKAGSTL